MSLLHQVHILVMALMIPLRFPFSTPSQYQTWNCTDTVPFISTWRTTVGWGGEGLSIQNLLSSILQYGSIHPALCISAASDLSGCCCVIIRSRFTCPHDQCATPDKDRQTKLHCDYCLSFYPYPPSLRPFPLSLPNPNHLQLQLDHTEHASLPWGQNANTPPRGLRYIRCPLMSTMASKDFKIAQPSPATASLNHCPQIVCTGRFRPRLRRSAGGTMLMRRCSYLLMPAETSRELRESYM